MPNDRTSTSAHSIGLFDSGVGGLCVLRAVARELPQHDLVYYADQANCPYGPRPAKEVQALSRRIVEFLLAQGCGVIVVACNTASAAALYDLREAFPSAPIVGMEPAVKPAARATRSGKVAVLATVGTLQGDLFTQTRATHARNVEVVTVYPSDWVERVERGDIDSEETHVSVQRVVEPLIAQGIDEIALGCTHYPFLLPLIERVARGRAAVLDPSTAVAQQTARLARIRASPPGNPPTRTFFTSGNPSEFARVLARLVPELTGPVIFEPL